MYHRVLGLNVISVESFLAAEITELSMPNSIRVDAMCVVVNYLRHTRNNTASLHYKKTANLQSSRSLQEPDATLVQSKIIPR